MAVCESIWSFCVYDDPSADLCLHKDLYLANVHHRAVKRDGVQSIRKYMVIFVWQMIEVE